MITALRFILAVLVVMLAGIVLGLIVASHLFGTLG